MIQACILFVMDHFIQIYNHEAEAYHRMITAEDVDKNIYPAINKVRDTKNARILDLGTGTGRLPLLLNEQTAKLVGVDIHWAMLQENLVQKSLSNGRWDLLQGDLRKLPFKAGIFDFVTAGWAMGHFCGWYPDRWQIEIDSALGAMQTLLTTGGAVVILETLGTGTPTASPPTKALENYYNHLENTHGFSRQEIQTDYQFESVDEATQLTEFFFGADLSMAIRKNNWSRLPEWTGVWSRVFP